MTDTFDVFAHAAPVTLFELEVGMCKWPLEGDGPTRYCGAKAEGPYCARHSRMGGAGFKTQRRAYR